MSSVALLIDRIKQGEKLQGTYIRRAHITEKGAEFEELIVKADNGAEYYTRTEQVCDGFFELVNYRGFFINGEMLSDGCHYESMAYWEAA